MKKETLIIFFLSSILLGQFEIIPISESISTKTAKQLWPVFNNGSIMVTDHELIIPDESSLFVQERNPPYSNTKINLKRHKKDYFTTYQVVANKQLFAYSVLGSDGRFYLFEKRRNTGEVKGPILRHGMFSERLFLLKDDKLVATGAHRPELISYLDRHRRGPIEEQRKNNKEKFDGLYLNHKAYTLSVYDKQLTEIDSGNVLNRIGDNARAYEGSYIAHPVDITDDGVLYLIDSDQGYVIEKYKNVTEYDSSFKVKNDNFRPLPSLMTLTDMEALRKRDRAYSVPYALYHKKGYLISCFFQAPVRHDPVVPPYYLDISTDQGELMYSGKYEYPILCEDEGEKLFAYVVIPGGWFEDDEHYLVGINVQQFLNGQVNKASIDACIADFRKE